MPNYLFIYLFTCFLEFTGNLWCDFRQNHGATICNEGKKDFCIVSTLFFIMAYCALRLKSLKQGSDIVYRDRSRWWKENALKIILVPSDWAKISAFPSNFSLSSKLHVRCRSIGIDRSSIHFERTVPLIFSMFEVSLIQQVYYEVAKIQEKSAQFFKTSFFRLATSTNWIDLF